MTRAQRRRTLVVDGTGATSTIQRARRASQLMPAQHNLPAQRLQLIGREEDRRAVVPLLLEAGGRQVTLTGTGGVGKTQLALLIATSLTDSFPDGVWLAELAAVSDPDLVPRTVISVLGLAEQPGEAVSQTLVSWIGRRRMLLVLDNCEHLIDACAQLVEALLHGCPNLRILATSRQPLKVDHERVWRVPSLAMPDSTSAPSPERIAQYAATQLFVRQARAVRSGFGLTPRNAALVAAICARLDGLPLAIELAAAWVRVLGVEEILERLDDTFQLLVGGRRSAPSRQQTMRATLDWSHGLLSEAERILFRRLAVFVDGWSLEAAVDVCPDNVAERHELLARLARLVDASLVQAEDWNQRTRFRLLEPVRQFAQTHLRASGEVERLRRKHALHFRSFAIGVADDANLGGSGREAAFSALAHEQGNLRAALRWSLEHGDGETGITLGRAQWTFWVVRGLITEGRSWMAQLGALPDVVKSPGLRAVARSIEATFAWRQGDYGVAQALLQQALPFLEQSPEPRLRHSVPADLGVVAMYQGDYSAAKLHFEAELAAARALGHRADEAVALENLGTHALMLKDYPTARTLCEQSVAIAREMGDPWALGMSLTMLEHAVLYNGDLSNGRQLVEEGLAVVRQIGDRFMLGYSLEAAGRLAIAEGRYTEARAALHEDLRVRQDLGSRSEIAHALDAIAELAAAERDAERALLLAGAAARIREVIGGQASPMYEALFDAWMKPLRRTLGQDAVRSGWDAGQSLSIERAVELALSATEPLPPPPCDRRDMELSPRERHVAALLANGLTNRQIADQLTISQRTVATHIEHILEKLGFASRHQVAVWATQHGLHDIGS
jgi:predicted ATPase/DNA-binding CsgD family transcriptional regulator